MDEATRYLALGVFLASLALGSLDYSLSGGTVSPLTPAAALAVVIAFISMVFLDEGSSKLHKQFTEGALIAAAILDLLRIIDLVIGFPNPQYAVGLLYFALGYLEIKEITVFAVKPFKIYPHGQVVTALAIDPTPLLAAWYLYSFRRESLRKFVKSVVSA
ncbi:hypothetical protein EYM_02080 [Ignicoccus islandicus DSM 13165]|uniref:Uncharacterized protein n=1 Tax=Ignicoccus islandicus DSM 13165 TaxID=940295 RepID=A0A0U3DXQ2_9CREN|nr:hypothetical protein [Ignicoccus islandicus]ALU12282.1 hypothetical protein EYM_02080 [Ignicoccus islandicus DSM 13165]